MATHKPNIAEEQKHNRQSRISALARSIEACDEVDREAEKEKLIASLFFGLGGVLEELY